eukprot:1902328-Prymnesium_polylepis.1
MAHLVNSLFARDFGLRVTEFVRMFRLRNVLTNPSLACLARPQLKFRRELATRRVVVLPTKHHGRT